MDLPYAEDLNYWKSGTSAPDRWIEDAIDLIENLGGTVLSHAYGAERSGRAAYMINFVIGGEEFRLIWPVLPTKSGKPADALPAKRQAATMLYHDVKTKCLKAAIFGARTAFFEYLVLPDGRITSQVSNPELSAMTPMFLLERGSER